ncbi:MAG: biotin/lipoyl-containing protein [Candidatus Omnitrophota bacterium]
MREILLPELGEGTEKATVASWYFQVGEKVQAGDDVVELVTDKASFNVPVDFSGTIKKILVAPGQDAKVGDVLAVVEP